MQYEQEGLRRQLNLLQKEIGSIKKAKGDASEQLKKKADFDKQIADLATKVTELLKERDQKAARIGNIVDKDCHVSETEVSFRVRFDVLKLTPGLGRQPHRPIVAPRTESQRQLSTWSTSGGQDCRHHFPPRGPGEVRGIRH